MRKKNSVLLICMWIQGMYFVTLHHFVILQMKGTKFIATILTNYNLQITIANYNCSPYRRLLPKDSDRLAYGGLFLLPSNCDSCRWRAAVTFVSGLFIFRCIKLNRVENLFKYVHHGPFMYIINNRMHKITFWLDISQHLTALYFFMSLLYSSNSKPNINI